MSDVQEIFNRVITRGYYSLHSDSAMCNSITSARIRGDVSADECLLAKEQIDKYLLPTDCAYLQKALEKAGLPNTIEARTAIYKDWANRPKLLQEQAND